MNDSTTHLRDRITADMKDAMRAKATARLSTIRLLLAAIKQREVDERKTLADADIVAVIDKMVEAAQGLHHAVRCRQSRRPRRCGARRTCDPAVVPSFAIDGCRNRRGNRRRDGGSAGCRGGRSGADRQGDGRAQAQARRPRRHGRRVCQGQGADLTSRTGRKGARGAAGRFILGRFPAVWERPRPAPKPVARCPGPGTGVLIVGRASSGRPASRHLRTR